MPCSASLLKNREGAKGESEVGRVFSARWWINVHFACLCRGVIDVDNGEYDKLIITGKPFAFNYDRLSNSRAVAAISHLQTHANTNSGENSCPVCESTRTLQGWTQ